MYFENKLITFPMKRTGALFTLVGLLQSLVASNQLGWSTAGRGLLTGGRNSQHPLAQAPLPPLSCLQALARVSVAGKLMQIWASVSSGMKMGPVEDSLSLEGASFWHSADLALKFP